MTSVFVDQSVRTLGRRANRIRFPISLHSRDWLFDGHPPIRLLTTYTRLHEARTNQPGAHSVNVARGKTNDPICRCFEF